MDVELESPWLVAVWPGMGGIAQIAGQYLVQTLAARALAEIPADSFFDVHSVKVRAGLIQPPELPKNTLYGWKNPGAGPDLAIFIGDEQPPGRGYEFSNEILGVALEAGVTRVVTFAAMASPIRPEALPRVLAVASGAQLLDELREQSVEVLAEAEISGLNGVLLAAAAERGLDALCLLGEFPFFASALANPKASAAILRTFADLASLPLDLSHLDAQAADMERLLATNLKKLELAARTAAGWRGEEQPAAEVPPQEEGLDAETRARIEALFAEATSDRSQALALKLELDRLGAFKEFEDRFLDLFRQAE